MSLTRTQLVLAMLVLTVTAGVILGVTRALNQPPGSAPPTAGDSPPLTGAPRSVAPSSIAAASTPATVRIVVPAGNIDLRVVPGDGVHVPVNLAVHYPGTSEPGGGGNSLYYAHARPGMFLGLYSLHVGDEVRVYRADGSQVAYQVRTLRKVAATDLSVLRQTPFEEITLLTCTTYNPHDPRYIVTATPV